MKCLFKRHKFKHLGQCKIGKTIQKYLVCSDCHMTILSINVCSDYTNDYIKLPKPLYFERKAINRYISYKKNLVKLLSNMYGN